MGAALAATVGLAAGCDEFLDVPNPNNLEAEAVDEERDRAVLSQSAYQSFVSDYGGMVVSIAWFSNEARVGDTFPTRNEFGRRDIPINGAQNAEWGDMHEAAQFARTTIASIEAAGDNIDLARAYFTAGWGFLFVAELYCEGTVAENWTTSRGPMTSAAVMDTAIAHFQRAHDIAASLTGSEASGIKNASLVGIARAHLFNGRKTQAAQVAASVPAGFTYNLLHLDDPANRGRLGNDIWSFSESRISLVVGPEWRAMADAGDPRIAYVDMKRVAQDGQLNFFRQDKIKGWGSPDRLASKLEADYIEVEANGDPTAMFDFINERRDVGNLAPIAATTDMNVLLRELMEQKARDFWLEGKRIGDLRRLGESIVPYVIPPGDNYYKPELGLVGTQTCWPVPQSEINNNPLWPKS
jgi:hypothetical protein